MKDSNLLDIIPFDLFDPYQEERLVKSDLRAVSFSAKNFNMFVLPSEFS